jgi:hypothetical protein
VLAATEKDLFRFFSLVLYRCKRCGFVGAIAEGLFAGPVTYIGGEMDPYMSNYYDERSHIDKAFQNWNGSVYWIQGFQDWNVDPHQVFGGPIGTNWYQDYVDA